MTVLAVDMASAAPVADFAVEVVPVVVVPCALLVSAVATDPKPMLLLAALVSLQSAWSVLRRDAGLVVAAPLAAFSIGFEPPQQLVVALRRESH